MEILFINMIASKNALIIFTRNPELGKVKTRLAATIGNQSALEIYKLLIHHTVRITSTINANRYVFYSENIQQNDAWNPSIFKKELQNGKDLGERMQNAFDLLFKKGYQKIVIVGSDIYELEPDTIVIDFFENWTSFTEKCIKFIKQSTTNCFLEFARRAGRARGARGIPGSGVSKCCSDPPFHTRRGSG